MHFSLVSQQNGSFVDPEKAQKAARQAREDHKASVAQVEARRAIALAAVSRADADLSETRAEASAAASAVDQVREERI